MLDMGIIGSGAVFLGGHCPAYESREDVRVTAIADPHQPHRDAAGNRLGCANLYEDYRAVLDSAVEAVDICVPHDRHYEVVMAALDAGKHVLLEKPIALSLDEASAMIARARQKGLQFHVALNQRFYPAHRAVKEMLAAGKYGTPFMGVFHVFGDELYRMNQPDHWKGSWAQSGGGALADSGTHAVDLALWWFGRPKRISCQWGRFVVEADKADDNVIVHLGYEHMLADIVVSYSNTAEFWRESKWVYCRDALFHVQGDPACPLLLDLPNEMPSPVPVDRMDNWWIDSVAAGVHHWLNCLMGHAQPAFGPEAAAEALEIVNLAYQAAEEGRTLEVPPKSPA